MRHRAPPPVLLGLPCLLLGLAGCATQALESAPARPDMPWQPNIAANGELLPGKAGRSGLKLPPGYVLPANHALEPRPAESSIDTTHIYTLPELIDIAQSSNPSTRRAWNAARDAALAVGIARTAYVPHLTASIVGGYGTRHDNNAFNLENGGLAGSIINNTNTPRTQNNGHGEVQTLNMEWLLFDFGKREAIIDAASQLQLASNVLFTAAHQKVIYGVALAFYTHAAAVARARLVEQALRNARSVQAAAEARLHQGQGTIVDVAQTQQMTAQAELRLVQAQNGIENTYLELMTSMGIAPSTQLRTQDVAGRALNIDDMRMTDDMIRTAVSQRPDVLAAYAAAKAARSNVTAAKAEFLPKVFVTGNVAYTTGHLALSSVPGAGADSSPTLNLSSNNFSSLVLGGISVPIFDGGMRAAVMKQAQNRADSTQVTLEQTLDDSVKQIVAAENGLHTGLSAYRAASRLEAAAQTSFDAAFAAYRSGVGSITPATLAQSGLLDAQLARSDAYYAALIAAASLGFATGAIGNVPDQGADEPAR
ncbi:TolC family protein [Acetobacter sp.]|uniref:TolC family protein n=1 Tax=Acetobacter sp. TaxID=440 RepID=UPI0039E89F4A